MVLRLWLALSILFVLCLGPASHAAAEAVAPAATVDPADDPWLSEEGPPVPAPSVDAREQVVTSWLESSPTPHARAAALRRVRLELGLGDLPAPAYVVLAHASDEDPEIYSALARDLAPGTPALQLSHAAALWKAGETGPSIKAIGQAFWAMFGRIGPQLWLLENVVFMLLVVVISASLGFILLAALQVFPHAAHDLGDLLSGRTPGFARGAALAALLIAPLLLGEGVIGLALALFTLAFVYGKAGLRSMLAMAAVLLVIGLHPLAGLFSITSRLIEEDPIARAAMAVVAGTETRADVDLLEASFGEDLVAAHALAYRARRYGLEEVSAERLDALSDRYPADGVALANRGNIQMRRGETEAAINYYERAAAQLESPTLFFDLSQAYAKAFRMEEYEVTLSRAQRLGNAEVAALSSLGDAELVADVEFPTNLLYDRFRSHALALEPDLDLAAALAPGRLGERWYVTASAFALVALFGLLFADRFDHASLCRRCGHRICTRCEETVWSEEICDDCHHLFQNPDATDPSLRMARLQALSKREVKVDRAWLIGSLLVPGLAGFSSRRPDFALFGLLIFSWIAAWLVWPRGAFADPLTSGAAALICFAIPGTLAIFAYLGIVFASVVARKNR